MKKRYFSSIYRLCKGVLSLCVLMTLLANSCSKSTLDPIDDKIPTEENPVSNDFKATIAPVWDIERGKAMLLSGSGYQQGDILQLESGQQGKQVLTVAIVDGKVTFPTDLESINYRLSVLRGTTSYPIGNTQFNYVLRADIPNQDGKNIKGVVHIAGQGLADVVVSDGYDVTKTDAQGVYYLSSNKRTGYVFISIPANHELTETVNKTPKFYQFVASNPDLVDTRDFELKAVNNDDHVILALADMHLANRNSDLSQFQKGFIADVNQQIARLKSEGKQVYALTLGDQTWETYWYSNSFMLPEYVQQMSNLQAPVFNTIGNHDNDPYFANDWMSENAYRRILGPTYYSFNLGQVHYVVLDNVEYLNTGGSYGTVGSRDYNAKITENQLEWLAKDLASIPSTTPIVLSTHIQLHHAPTEQGNTPNFRTSNAQQLISLLDRFAEVHVMTGHTHVNYRVPRNDKFMEHNVAALSGTWWWTGRPGYSDNHIAPDGSPGGYGLWEMNGRNIAWKYKSIGYAPEYQFRAYDLNEVEITATKHAPAANATFRAMVPQYAADFAKANKNNEVLINVWGYDPKWTVSVTENGRPLDVQRISSYDPLQIISYGMQRLNVNATPTFDAANTSHMFKVKASAVNSTLQIKVTDRFGNTYSESMERPKAFTYSMR
ncbi:calcineurin-like phosphoesterase C-terminal domain-containing protein [Sphingobacterium corticibacter]|uniref:Metallophosphoesterase n=1 Tax=Sphingobacterium corticibacter TaxID=2171749 RepID=A0A2T8HG19_9SPHI|nr:calcineurin-like phosphoesterase family protein [Sphingobacterium corticibacter]PVH24262.1 metallophosphoesterase [Sphingobacterium corticibacter]